MENLIVVEQPPVIRQYLQSLKAKWEQKAADAEAMVCTEDTIQAVKAFRAEMRKEFEEVEALRKQVKSAVMKPYNDLEAVYKDCVTNSFKIADTKCSWKIADVESEMKRRCEDGLREYFAELCSAHGLDWLEYEHAGITVDMASAKAKTPKRLREKLIAFVVGVSADIETISNMEAADEILVEYKNNGLDATKAIGAVQERNRRKQEERAALDTMAEQKAIEKAAVARVEVLARPVVIEPEKTVRVSLVLYPTKAQFNEKIEPIMQQLKAVCDMEGIKYE